MGCECSKEGLQVLAERGIFVAQVFMLKESDGMRYLVLAREDLSSYVEGRVTNKTSGICQFVLKDIISRHGSFNQMRADRGEMDSKDRSD